MTAQNPSEGERLETMLKNEAKALLKLVKAGQPEALHRVGAYFKTPEGTTLQQVQLVVAREHGLGSWKKLKAQAHAYRRPDALSPVLQETLAAAFNAAGTRRHQVFTVEHALLALLEMPKVVDVLSHVGCDLDLLRRQLATSIDQSALQQATDKVHKTRPAPGFKRVMQTAVFHVMFAEKEATETNVLVSIYSHESTARDLLIQQNVTRMRIVDYLMSDK